MGIIEKAINENVVDASLKQARPQRSSVPQDQPTFPLNYKELGRLGFYSPASRATPLALELRAIKRRLLRRVGFFSRKSDTRLAQNSGRRRNLILVTSTRPAEGKTFTAINLALSLAAEEQIETLLVDADTPRPKVRSYFGLPGTKGLTDAIIDPSLNVETLAYRAENAPLSILPEGAPVARADEVFRTAETQQVFTDLSTAQKDRIVIFDAPPVLATTEAVVLARYVDEVVFVIEADSTPEPAVAAALDELLEVNPNIALVLNRCLLAGGGTHYGSYERYENYGSGRRVQDAPDAE